jgi:hypothetical protein
MSFHFPKFSSFIVCELVENVVNFVCTMEQEKNKGEGEAIPEEKILERRVWVEQHKRSSILFEF